MKYGYIVDIDTDDVINICGGTEHNKLLYVSTGSQVQVVMELSNHQNNKFLLQFTGNKLSIVGVLFQTSKCIFILKNEALEKLAVKWCYYSCGIIKNINISDIVLIIEIVFY